jgi:general secretion pathway protein I
MKAAWIWEMMGERAFTLLEVMVALAVIAIALAAVISLQAQAVSLSSEARFQTTAALLAKGKAAEIKAQGEVGSSWGDFGKDFPGYKWSAALEDAGAGLPFDGSFHLKRVKLTVSWGEGNYNYGLTFYLFSPGGR